MSKGIVRSLGTGRFLGWEALDAIGYAGEVLVVWDKRSLVLLDKELGSFSVFCWFRNVVTVLFGFFLVSMVLFLRMVDPSFGNN